MSTLRLAPITSLEGAKAFIRSLSDNGLLFHFDDGAQDCLARTGLVSAEQAAQIDDRVHECYDFDWGSFYECPIGFCLEVDDLRQRFCGLNADWSVDAWHYGPSERPNTNGGDLYVYDNEDEVDEYVVARVTYDEADGETLIDTLATFGTLSEAHNCALTMAAERGAAS